MVRVCTFPGCGRRTVSASTRRCPLHPPGLRGNTRATKKQRAQLLAEESVCFICGGLPTPHDPLVAGHILARTAYGPDHRSNYHAVHASCNTRQGSAPMLG